MTTIGNYKYGRLVFTKKELKLLLKAAVKYKGNTMAEELDLIKICHKLKDESDKL